MSCWRLDLLGTMWLPLRSVRAAWIADLAIALTKGVFEDLPARDAIWCCTAESYNYTVSPRYSSAIAIK